MHYEFRDLDEREIEETRRSLVNKAHSKNQTHAGYLIAFVIGSLTIISRWDIFFDSSQESSISITGLLFFVIIGAIASIIFYFIQRACYWTSYGSAAETFSIRLAINLFDKYKSKPENRGLQEQVSPLYCILSCGVAQHLEDLQTTNVRLNWSTKFAVIGREKTIALSLLVGVIVFYMLIIGYGLLLLR
jgi:hypothetical protein